MKDEKKRALSDHRTQQPVAGDAHYKAYVGSPQRLGAIQFRLLVTLGLCKIHRVLDFGCGSPKAGHLLIPFLQISSYFGVEPCYWLVEDGITKHLGQDLINLKHPQFSDNNDFPVPFHKVAFDFDLAKSIFSYSGSNVVQKLLHEFACALALNDLMADTFSLSKNGQDLDDSGWIYLGCEQYREETICVYAHKAGLVARVIPFFHLSQDWFLIAFEEQFLPTDKRMWLSKGTISNVEVFGPSVQTHGDNAS
jgi:hypothetical protein